MNRIKSVFVTSAITVWAVFTYLFVMQIVNHAIHLGSLGLLLVSALPLSFFIVLMALRPAARTSRSLAIFTILISLGAVLVFIDVYHDYLPAYFTIIALMSVVMWFLYVYWYSTLPVGKAGVEVGDKMPALTLINENGQEISTADFARNKLLYMFYRGNWCPLCMAQIKEISGQYKELEKRGVVVLLISPQPASYSKSLAKKMSVNFRFLTDKDNTMARLLKIDHQAGTPMGMEMFGYKSETVLPTVIITNENDEVVFIDQTDNYRIRPEPATFLKIIDDLN